MSAQARIQQTRVPSKHGSAGQYPAQPPRRSLHYAAPMESDLAGERAIGAEPGWNLRAWPKPASLSPPFRKIDKLHHALLQNGGRSCNQAVLEFRLRSFVFNFKEFSIAFSAYMASSIASLSPS